jgi:hypothetical protein
MSITHSRASGIPNDPAEPDLIGGEDWDAEHVFDLTAADVGAAEAVHTHDYEASGAVATHAAAGDPHTGYQKESEKAQASGYASLDGDTKVPIAQLPTGTTGTTVALGNAAAGLISTHEAAADPHTGYLKENDANWTDLTDGGETALHSHAGGPGGEAFPVGAVFIAVVSTDPATLLGYGTWSAFGAGRVLVGRDSGDTDFDTAEETGGAKTKAISAHAGAAVGNHSFTQPTAAGEAAHTHTYTQVVNHVHVQSVNSATTGGLSGYAPDTSTNTSVASGYSTANPTGGVASGTTAAGSSHTHTMSGGAVDAHSVTQPSGHSDLNVVQPYIVVYMWKRTA